MDKAPPRASVRVFVPSSLASTCAQYSPEPTSREEAVAVTVRSQNSQPPNGDSVLSRVAHEARGALCCREPAPCDCSRTEAAEPAGGALGG